jgi:hypothetical protein
MLQQVAEVAEAVTTAVAGEHLLKIMVKGGLPVAVVGLPTLEESREAQQPKEYERGMVRQS